MPTAEQYRARVSEYAGLLNDARSPAETRMFRELEPSYLSLAEKMEWLAANPGKRFGPALEVQPSSRAESSVAPV